jgi:hypothetical protein
MSFLYLLTQETRICIRDGRCMYVCNYVCMYALYVHHFLFWYAQIAQIAVTNTYIRYYNTHMQHKQPTLPPSTHNSPASPPSTHTHTHTHIQTCTDPLTKPRRRAPSALIKSSSQHTQTHTQTQRGRGHTHTFWQNHGDVALWH